MEIECKYDEFDRNLHEYLKEDYLKIGERKYDYFELAKMWEADQVPEELYFNHGSCFKINGKTGIEFVAEQLKKKPTSNRIVLSTIDMNKVFDSLDDSVYLPSLLSIQFGKYEQQDQLIVQMHLRALEAKRFLKINICEIAYILEKLREKSVTFNNVKINITAFRVQKKERFNCFLKARIDEMQEVDIAIKVSRGKIDELCELLNEKRDGVETITKMQGIKTVYEAMKASNKDGEGSRNLVYYKQEILTTLEKVLKVYKQLDNIHQSSSIQSPKEIECEKNIDQLLENLIHQLQECDKTKGMD